MMHSLLTRTFSSKKSKWALGLLASLGLSVAVPVIAQAYTYIYRWQVGPYSWDITSNSISIGSFLDQSYTGGSTDHVHFYGSQYTWQQGAPSADIMYWLHNTQTGWDTSGIECIGNFDGSTDNPPYTGGDWYSVPANYTTYAMEIANIGQNYIPPYETQGSTYIQYGCEN